MKVDIEEVDHLTPFGQLEPGDTFMFEGGAWFKLKKIAHQEGADFGADLDSGQLMRFADSRRVQVTIATVSVKAMVVD